MNRPYGTLAWRASSAVGTIWFCSAVALARRMEADAMRLSAVGTGHITEFTKH